MSIPDLKDFYACANYFDHKHLQELLVADIIIPHLTPASALIFYQACKSELRY